jgi:anti-sigma B factor antagonist
VTATPGDDRVADDGNVIRLPAEIDEAVAPVVLRQIQSFVADPQGHTSVILDLSATAFLDSSGMGMLAAASGVCVSAGIRLLLRSPTPNVTAHLRMIGLLTFFDWVDE